MALIKYFSVLFRIGFLALFFVPAAVGQKTEEPFQQPFEEGCCFNPSFHRPVEVSRSTIPSVRLREALNCATNNWLVGGTADLAEMLGDSKSLHVAYYYGKYMPEQEGAALTVAVYSIDGRHGVLFDIDWESRKYYIDNLPPLLRGSKRWRVGEINGGLWSYTRLWYLAQEIGTRPQILVPVAETERAKPGRCFVMSEDQTGWTHGEGKPVGKTHPQATSPK
jgi:hypothetical protein